MSTNTPWPEERVAKLKVLWMQGLTCSQIGKQLGVTRCAIAGQARRHGLPRRMQKPRCPPSEHTIADIAAVERRRRALPPKLKPEPYVSRRAPEKGPTAIRWIDHKDFKHCAMFCAGESEAMGFVCGAPCAEGSVYCHACAGIAYRPAEERKAA